MCDLLYRVVSIKQNGERARDLGNNQYILAFDVIFVDKAGKALMAAKVIGF